MMTFDKTAWGNLSLNPSKHYADRQGARVQLRSLGTPDVSGICFAGQLTSDPQSSWRLYQGDGKCPSNADYDLVKEWPADETDTYYPIIQRDDATFRPISTAYAEIATLKAEWGSKAKFGLRIGTENAKPVSEIVEL